LRITRPDFARRIPILSGEDGLFLFSNRLPLKIPNGFTIIDKYFPATPCRLHPKNKAN
jgi:hypothetical protein